MTWNKKRSEMNNSSEIGRHGCGISFRPLQRTKVGKLMSWHILERGIHHFSLLTQFIRYKFSKSDLSKLTCTCLSTITPAKSEIKSS